MMWMANEAMNGTLSENLEKTLDEAGERDFKIMRMLCGEITAQDVPPQMTTIHFQGCRFSFFLCKQVIFCRNVGITS